MIVDTHSFIEWNCLPPIGVDEFVQLLAPLAPSALWETTWRWSSTAANPFASRASRGSCWRSLRRPFDSSKTWTKKANWKCLKSLGLLRFMVDIFIVNRVQREGHQPEFWGMKSHSKGWVRLVGRVGVLKWLFFRLVNYQELCCFFCTQILRVGWSLSKLQWRYKDLTMNDG